MIKEDRETNNIDWEVVPLENNDFEVKYTSTVCEPSRPWLNSVKDLEFGDQDFTIEFDIHTNAAPLCEVVNIQQDNHFVMYNDENQMLVDVNLGDGSIVFGDAYNPDDAARVFWNTIGKMKQQPLDEAWEEYETSLQTPEEILREVRQNLGVPEGESIVEYSAQFSAPPGIADDMPEEYTNPFTGWTLVEEKCEGEVSEELIKDIVKDIQATHFDKSIEGLIDG